MCVRCGMWGGKRSGRKPPLSLTHTHVSLIVIVCIQHKLLWPAVKFRNGIPGRYARMAASATTGDNNDRAADCISVLLNPTLIDTRPSGSVASTQAAMSSSAPESITLQLRYLKDGVSDIDEDRPESTGGVLPLADYLLIG